MMPDAKRSEWEARETVVMRLLQAGDRPTAWTLRGLSDAAAGLPYTYGKGRAYGDHFRAGYDAARSGELPSVESARKIAERVSLGLPARVLNERPCRCYRCKP